jgi:RNA polymerase primary sigma factor
MSDKTYVLDDDVYRRAAAGEKEAIDVIVLTNQGIVYQWARKLANRIADGPRRKQVEDELVTEGQFGLMRAARLFEIERGWKFSTYATHAVYRTMRRHIDCEMNLIRIPPVPMEKYEREVARARKVSSLDSAGDDGDRKLSDMVPGREVDFDKLEQSSMLEDWIAGIADERHREVIQRRLAGQTLKVAAEAMGLSRERIRQIETQAVRDMFRQAQPNESIPERLWNLEEKQYFRATGERATSTFSGKFRKREFSY